MDDGRQPVTREELQLALDQALERYVTKDEFSGFVQLMIAEHERSARRHDTLVELIGAMDQRLVLMISTTEEQLRGELGAAEQRLMIEIGRAAQVASEENRREIGVLDDRYRDLPVRVAALERGLREHVEDAAAHGRPRRPKRKR